MKFVEQSYQIHKDVFRRTYDERKMYTWARDDTVDAWRHRRMRTCLDPLLESHPGAAWLTVGDGKYGTDAHYVRSKGGSVLATDISDFYLRRAKQDRFIDDYRIENAENLSFLDESFDFVLCKESYHHFPRPMVALYEMLRVAKIAAIMIEPNDFKITNSYDVKLLFGLVLLWRSVKNAVKKIFGRKIFAGYGDHEETDNYVYTISAREIEKVALGLNYEYVAVKGLNDYYLANVEYEPATASSGLFKKIRCHINYANLLVKLGLRDFGLMVFIIFKDKPKAECLAAIEKHGYRMLKLPKNPYHN